MDDEVIDLTDNEGRRALSRRVTDGPIQDIATILLRAETLRKRPGADPAEREGLAAIIRAATRARDELREIRRSLAEDTFELTIDLTEHADDPSSPA